MAERLTYEAQELRDAIDYVSQQAKFVAEAHAGNWRRFVPRFVEEMTSRFECLKLLTHTLLGGHTGVHADVWFKEAEKGHPAPISKRPYEAMALVWKQLACTVAKPGEGFMTKGTFVDLPYVISNAFPGESFGHRFELYRQHYLEPFTLHLIAWGKRILDSAPPKGRFDLWDAAMACVNDLQHIPKEVLILPAPPTAAEALGLAAKAGPAPTAAPQAAPEAPAPEIPTAESAAAAAPEPAPPPAKKRAAGKKGAKKGEPFGGDPAEMPAKKAAAGKKGGGKKAAKKKADE